VFIFRLKIKSKVQEKMEEVKMQIRQTAENTAIEKRFTDVYKSLQGTLKNVYQESGPANDEFDFDTMIMRWADQLTIHKQKIHNQDSSLMLDNLEVLLELNIPNLWVSNKFTAQSKKYIWMYIKELSDLAFQLRPADNNTRDIDPLPGMAIPGLGPLGSIIPPSLIDKVQKSTASYDDNQVADVDFDTMSQDIMKQIDKDELQGLLQGVSGLMQNLFQQ
jgi:hypothetical protein